MGLQLGRHEACRTRRIAVYVCGIAHVRRRHGSSCRRACASQDAAPAISGGVFLDWALSDCRFHRVGTWAVVSAGAGQVAMLGVYDAALGESARVAVSRRADWSDGKQLAIGVALAGIACMFGPLARGRTCRMACGSCRLRMGDRYRVYQTLQQRANVDVFGLSMWQMLFGGAILTIVAPRGARACHDVERTLRVCAYI